MIAAFLVLLRLHSLPSPPPQAAMGRVVIDDRTKVVSAESSGEAESLASEDHGPVELVSLPPPQAKSVTPQGWRRTDQGWEDVSAWRRPARPLGVIVLEQELRERGWLMDVLGELRAIPPLGFALLQLVIVWAIVAVSRSERQRRFGA